MEAEKEQKGPSPGEQATSIASDEIKGRAGHKVAQKVGEKVATRATGKVAVGATMGTALGPIGTVAGFIASELVSKAITFLNKKKHILLPAGLVAGGLALAPVAPVVGAGMAGVGVIAGAGAAAGATAGLASAFLAGLGSITATFFAAAGATVAGIALFTIFALVVINNSALIVPPAPPGGLSGGLGGTTAFCEGENEPKPVPSSIIFSNTGRYAFPVAPDGGYSAYHWDGERAVDIFPIATGGSTGSHLPVVSYTNGVIESVVLNDPLGGKYVILRGDDERFYYYAHNCAVYVDNGQRVATGEVIATTGNTGSAKNTPEHLHFAINSSSFFPGGGGLVCPQADFIEKGLKGETPEINLDSACVVPIDI